MEKLAVRMFGRFEAERSGQPLVELNRREGKRLLAYLILHHGQDVSYRTLAERFWPSEARDVAEGKGDLASTRQAIRYLRMALGPDADRLKHTGKSAIRLDVEGMEIDLLAFERAIATNDRESVLLALQLYHGPLLEDWTDTWIRPARLRCEREFERLSRLVAPSGGEKLTATPVYAGSPPRYPSTPLLSCQLPVPITRFVGREGELAQLRSRYASCRLLTLTGPGGCGKTRLALRFADEALAQGMATAGPQSESLHGVCFVDLSSLDSAELVAPAICHELGLQEKKEATAMQMLLSEIRSKSLLLILDNCEHIASACREVCTQILRTCPGVRILATGRAALNLQGEFIFPVEPMATPDPVEPHTAESIADYDAVRLFVDRAMARVPGFVLRQDNVADIVELCWRLDGLPLAIELATARLRTFSLAEINERLEHRFRLLTGGEDDRPARQQTLRALIDWSFNLLSAREKDLFRRLAVFYGGWTTEAASRVASFGAIDRWEVPELIQSLSEKSLVRPNTDGQVTRFSMLTSIREYADEKLQESGERERVQTAHRNYFLMLAEDAAPHLQGTESEIWMQRLEAEHDNLRRALDWTVQQTAADTADVAGRLIRVLTSLWNVRGMFSEGRFRIRSAFAATTNLAAPVPALKTMASSLLDLGDHDGATEAQGRIAAFHRERYGIGPELAGMAQLSVVLGRRTLYSFSTQTERVRAQLRDRVWGAFDLWGLVCLAGREGRALLTREQWAALHREVGDMDGLANAARMGNLAFVHGDYASARLFFEEALANARDEDDPAAEAMVRSLLGSVFFRQAELASARFHLEQSEILNRMVGDRRLALRNRRGLAEITRDVGDFDIAHTLYAATFALGKEAEDVAESLRSLDSFGIFLLLREETIEAIRLWAAAERVRQETGKRMRSGDHAYMEPFWRAARERVGDATFSQERQTGRQRTLRESLQRVDTLLRRTEEGPEFMGSVEALKRGGE